MNSKYLENLLTSKLFEKDLINFLEKNFIKIYEEKRIKKIENFVEKIQKKFFESGDPDLSALKDYLENNSKCKLPWSNYELKLAKSSVMQLLQQKTMMNQGLALANGVHGIGIKSPNKQMIGGGIPSGSIFCNKGIPSNMYNFGKSMKVLTNLINPHIDTNCLLFKN